MKTRTFAAALLCAVSLSALSQQAATFRDLEPMQPSVLSKEELQQLLPGARMSRISARGYAHAWTNEAGGNFIARSNNAGISGSGTSSSVPGKWHISDDGRYCVLIEWRGADTEEWCRFIVKTTDGYYATRSTSVGTERVYKLDIRGK